MKKLGLCFGLTIVILASGCGGDDETSLTSGNYSISDIKMQQNSCNLLEAGVFQSNNNTNINPMSIEGNTITLFTEWANKPSGTIEEDRFEALIDFEFDNSISDDEDPDFPTFNCKEHITKTVEGTIEDSNTFTATYTYKSEYVGGSECAQLEYSLPCTSVITFKATKVAE